VNLPGVDCDAPISGALLVRAGKAWVGRYMGRHPSGDLTVAEAADLHSNGIGILPIYEFSNDDLGTKPSAFVCAETSVADAQALGIPLDRTVGAVLCEDRNNPGPNVEGDMLGAAVVQRAGGLLSIFYGRKEIARGLLRAGAIDGAFVVDTWGADEPGDVWNFRQLPNAGQTTIGGVTCDIDDAPAPVGLWLPQNAPPPSPPPPPVPAPVVVRPIQGDPDVSKEITETCTLGKDPNGPGAAGWFTIGEFAADVLAVNVGGADPVATGGYPHFDEPTWEQVATGITKVQVVSPDPAFVGKSVTVTVVVTTGT